MRFQEESIGRRYRVDQGMDNFFLVREATNNTLDSLPSILGKMLLLVLIEKRKLRIHAIYFLLKENLSSRFMQVGKIHIKKNLF